MSISFGAIEFVFNLVWLNCDDFFEYCQVSTMRGHPYRFV